MAILAREHREVRLPVVHGHVLSLRAQLQEALGHLSVVEEHREVQGAEAAGGGVVGAESYGIELFQGVSRPLKAF